MQTCVEGAMGFACDRCAWKVVNPQFKASSATAAEEIALDFRLHICNPPTNQK